jgi:hypothetical protein
MPLSCTGLHKTLSPISKIISTIDTPVVMKLPTRLKKCFKSLCKCSVITVPTARLSHKNWKPNLPYISDTECFLLCIEPNNGSGTQPASNPKAAYRSALTLSVMAAEAWTDLSNPSAADFRVESFSPFTAFLHMHFTLSWSELPVISITFSPLVEILLTKFVSWFPLA